MAAKLAFPHLYGDRVEKTELNEGCKIKIIREGRTPPIIYIAVIDDAKPNDLVLDSRGQWIMITQNKLALTGGACALTGGACTHYAMIGGGACKMTTETGGVEQRFLFDAGRLRWEKDPSKVLTATPFQLECIDEDPDNYHQKFIYNNKTHRWLCTGKSNKEPTFHFRSYGNLTDERFVRLITKEQVREQVVSNLAAIGLGGAGAAIGLRGVGAAVGVPNFFGFGGAPVEPQGLPTFVGAVALPNFNMPQTNIHENVNEDFQMDPDTQETKIDITYNNTDKAKDDSKRKPTTVWKLPINNSNSTPLTVTIEQSEIDTTTDSSEWIWNNKFAVTAETKIKTAIPFLSDGEISFKAENTFEIGKKTTESHTKERKWAWNAPICVDPYTKVECRLVVQKGTINVPFTALITTGRYQRKEVGTYKGVSYSSLEFEILKQSDTNTK